MSRHLIRPSRRRTLQEIETAALRLREVLGTGAEAKLDVIEAFDSIQDRGVVVAGRKMPAQSHVSDLPEHTHGYAQFDARTNCFSATVSEVVYRQAERGWGAARFTMAHEIAHLELHPEDLFNMHLSPALFRSVAHPVICDVEWQADSFASALIAPAVAIGAMYVDGASEQDMATAFAMSTTAVRTRIRALHQWDMIPQKKRALHMR